MRKKYIKRVLAFLFAALLLTGCDRKKEVTYNNETSEIGSSTDMYQDDNLEKTLGVDALTSIWHDTVEAKKGETEIWTEIVVPQASGMRTLIVSEKDLTGEDKKKMLTYFVDEQKLSVDAENEFTKEKCQQEIDNINKLLELEGINSEEFNEELVLWDRRMKAAPEEEKLSANVSDYSNFNYLGGGYRFRFFTKSVDGYSGMCMKKIDGDEYDKSNLPTDPTVNLSVITTDEVEEMAKGLCADLGISNMAVREIVPHKVVGMLTTGEYVKFYDGYEIELVKCVDGVAADGNLYSQTDDPETSDLDYYSETVRVIINDKGIYFLDIKGIGNEENLGPQVKLLEVEQIKDILKKEFIKGTVHVSESDELLLTYIRIKSEDNTDELSYIPVWRYGKLNWGWDICIATNVGEFYPYIGYMFINAIDGSVITSEQIGTMKMVEEVYLY